MTQEDLRFLELLNRWANGDATRSDEQELLLLSQNDEFRKTALVGYFEHPEITHDQHLAAIQQRLNTIKTPKPHIYPLYKWLSIAAVGLVLLVASLFFWQKTALNAPLATQLPVQTPRKTPAETREPEKTNTGTLPATNRPGAGPIPDANPAHAKQTPARKEQQESQLMESQAIAASPAIPAPAPIASAPPTRADDMDSFPKKADKPPATPGYDKLFNDDFKSYLKKSARLPEAARNQNISGNVYVRFVVNEQGRAEQIEITSGLGYGCDELAKTLLQNWVFSGSTQGAFVQYAIPFVR